MFQTFACSQYDDYAAQCKLKGVDISNWRESVDYCRKFSWIIKEMYITRYIIGTLHKIVI